MISPMSAPTAKAAVTVGSSSTLALAASAGGLRSHATLQADPTNTEPIYLGFGAPAVQDYGFALYPGQSYAITQESLFVGIVYAICASGGQTLRVSSDVAGLGPYPGSESYDVSTGADQVWPLLTPRGVQDSPQKVATGLGDGTEHEYFDVEQGKDITIHITDTPGVAGDNTYTLWESVVNDGTAEGAAKYINVTQDELGQAEITTADIVADPQLARWKIIAFQAKRYRVTHVRANDGANTDGGYKYDGMWM